MIELSLATPVDMPVIMDICDDARRFQREQGFNQWPDGYPSEEVIAADMTASRGFMILLDGVKVGYCVIDFAGESEYDRLSDIWTSAVPYAAVHRLALSANTRGKRMGLPLFEVIERFVVANGISVVKVDTGLENIRMQRLLVSAGYSDLGIQQFEWGPRIAYEKMLLNK
ncbi:MAG: GNAT family N-acetyltransferase [Muribaculaceae bacterium]|nr:GNAT family N-acetyltransferase [Muribaculaceae bacterium]